MTQEEKQLLLQDLSARLPYDVIVVDHYGFVVLFTWKQMKDFEDGYISKPYLRPLSSMTEAEKDEFNNLFSGSFQYFNQGVISDSRTWDKNEAVFVGELDCSKLIDWLNAHHFDYRGLIPKGLAIEVTEDNNPYK